MAAERLPQHSIAAHGNQPVVSVFVDVDSDVVHYCIDDRAASLTQPSADAEAALAVIGAWSDMDWNELAESLDRIRHESAPTPLYDAEQ